MIRVAANLCTVLVGQGTDTLRNPENLSNKKQQCSFSQRESHCQSCAANWGTARERESHRIYIRNTSTFLFKVRGGWESPRRAYEPSSKQDPRNRAGLNLKHSEMTLQRKTEKEKLWLILNFIAMNGVLHWNPVCRRKEEVVLQIPQRSWSFT